MGLKLEATKCKICSTVFIPPKKECDRCSAFGKALEPYDLENQGRIDRISYYPHRDIDYTGPRTVAFVKLADGTIVMCIALSKEPKVEIGDEVLVLPGKDGRYYFEPPPSSGPKED